MIQKLGDLITHSKDILCIQFGNKTNQYLVEWDDALVEHIKPIMEDSNKLFLFQNAKFDLQFYIKRYNSFKNI